MPEGWSIFVLLWCYPRLSTRPSQIHILMTLGLANIFPPLVIMSQLSSWQQWGPQVQQPTNLLWSGDSGNCPVSSRTWNITRARHCLENCLYFQFRFIVCFLAPIVIWTEAWGRFQEKAMAVAISLACLAMWFLVICLCVFPTELR